MHIARALLFDFASYTDKLILIRMILGYCKVSKATYLRKLLQDVHITAGRLFLHLMCTRLVQRQTGGVEASLCIVPCIYSLIGAYPGVLQLSAAHEGISGVCCAVLVKYVASCLCKIFKTC